MAGILHYYFRDSIGQGDWFTYGTTLEDMRYAVEGQAAFAGELDAATALPAEVVFHYPKCYGGDVWEGYGIYNYKRSLAARGVKTTSLVEGLCASIATLTALGSDTVLMADAAIWMVHKPMADAGPGANADDHAAAITILNKIQDQLVGRYVARSGGKLDAATAHALVNGESFLTADECLTYGFITGKLEDAPLVVPAEAAKVLNTISPTALKNARMATTTPAAPASYGIAEFFNDARTFFAGPKNEAPAETPAVAPTAMKHEVAGGDPMYCAEAELAEGNAVFSDEALTVAYPDGAHALTDGRTATVTGGVVETLTAAAEAAAAPDAATAALTAENEALKAELETLKASNALQARNITGLTNRLAAVVPGSTGAPTKAGEAQNVAGKPGEEATPPTTRQAERSIFGNIK